MFPLWRLLMVSHWNSVSQKQLTTLLSGANWMVSGQPLKRVAFWLGLGH
jgi:hypothetical protein